MSVERPESASALLETFRQALGEAGPDWAALEELRSISYQDQHLDESVAAHLPLSVMKPLATAYGDALTCRFLLDKLVVLEIDHELDEARHLQFLDSIQGVGQVTLDLRLDKEYLCQQWFGDTPAHCSHFLYLYPEAAARYFQEHTIWEIEEELWEQESARKVIVLVPDYAINLDGAFLSIVGGEAINDRAKRCPEVPPDTAHTEQINTLAQDALKWQMPWVQSLTPYHLHLEGETDLDDPLSQALHIHLLNLLMLYTADRTVQRHESFFSTYAGAQQSLEIAWGNSARDEISAAEAQALAALFRVFEWAYDRNWSPVDRLPLAQISIVETINVVDPALARALLIQNAAAIEAGLRWHWRELVEKNIEGYIGQVHRLENLVSETVREFATQVDTITKNLTDAMLAFVGVLIGSFIVAILKDPFNDTIFRIGMLIYAGYLLVFPLVYNMRNQWERFRAQEEDFAARRKSYEQRLHKDKVAEIVGDAIKKSRKRFLHWFWWTVAIYLLVMLLAVVAAFVAPVITPV